MGFADKKTESKKAAEKPVAGVQKQKPTPAFLRDDYSYKADGSVITDMSQVRDNVIYEIKCSKCELSIRSQGQNIRVSYERMKNNGCIGCGNRDLAVRRIDM